MSSQVRVSLLALLVCAVFTAGAPAAQASFGVTEAHFEAGTCTNAACTYSSPKSDFFTQAAGHPPYGITSFEMNSNGTEPEGALKRVRVDIPPGLAADPQALPACSDASFAANTCPPNTKVGVNQLTVYDGISTLSLEGTVYNLAPRAGTALSGEPLYFGINVGAEPLTDTHIFLEGHVEWANDYHEYFEIKNIPDEGELLKPLSLKVPLKVLKSKLIFEGTAGAGNFLTLPSVCAPSTTSHIEVESYEGAVSSAYTHTPVGVEGCDKVPFAPSTEVTPATAASDQPDGASTVVKVPQKAGAAEANTSDIRNVNVTLPEGMTLDPSAAHGLEACTAAQIAIGSTAPVSCPAGAKIGTVTIQTDLPPNSLTGSVYLGSPSGAAITGPPYTIYIDAESVYGVSVRLQGTVAPDPSSGRLTVSFANNPQLPFSELVLTTNGGPRAPLANPLVCGNTTVDSVFTPYTGAAQAISSTPFTTSGCASPLPFSLAQSTQSSSSTAGAYTSYTFNLTRADGQQYLSRVSAVLPPGLVGAIPSVPLCQEPQAQAGTCSATSQIGTATASVGAGGDPYAFSGPVFLTGPYDGAPYGLSVPIDASAGPFALGSLVTRVGLSVDEHSGRVIATSTLPTIFKGIPLRLKGLSVAIDRSSFLFNPTNCGVLHTESSLTSTMSATQSLSSPFQVGGCSSLPFKPTFKASTSAHASKKNGASLEVSLVQGPHEANLQSVVAQLPLQLPSRLATLQKACVAATFEANPFSCPSAAKVGSAKVITPVLPGALSGPAYLVSHGGAGFPDLDLVLEGDGVRVILVGNTNIKGGVTTSTFGSIPDVPVSSFSLDLPMASNSALSPYGNLCLKPLVMPTTITAQSGAQIKQSTRIAVTGCGVRILSHRVVRHKLILKVRTLGGGLITVKGRDLRGASRRVGRSATVTFKLPLSRAGARALRRHRHGPLSVAFLVSFRPAQKGQSNSAASATATFRH